MDAAWLKDSADFIMLGFGIAGGVCWMIWKASKSIYEKKHGPSESSGVTKGDLKHLHETISCGFAKVDVGFERVDDRMDTMDTTMSGLKSDIRSVGERTGRLESRHRITDEKVDSHSAKIARIDERTKISSS